MAKSLPKKWKLALLSLFCSSMSRVSCEFPMSTVLVYVSHRCLCVCLHLCVCVFVWLCLCLCALSVQFDSGQKWRADCKNKAAATWQQTSLYSRRLRAKILFHQLEVRCLSASFQCLDRPMEKTPPMYSWCKQACKMQSPKLRALSFITVLLCSRFVLFFHQDFRKVLGRVKPTYLTIREQILRWKYYLPDNLT